MVPLAQEPADWRKERARSLLTIADHVRKSAASYARETECDYGRRWAYALETHTREELLALGYEEPVLQPGRNPETKANPPAPRPWPPAADWVREGVEGGPDPGSDQQVR